MGYKDQFKVGDIVSGSSNIHDVIDKGLYSEVVGYKNIENVFHLKLKDLTGRIYNYPAMYGEFRLTNFGKKQVVDLLWIKK